MRNTAQTAREHMLQTTLGDRFGPVRVVLTKLDRQLPKIRSIDAPPGRYIVVLHQHIPLDVRGREWNAMACHILNPPPEPFCLDPVRANPVALLPERVARVGIVKCEEVGGT